jgi:sirohydrochlorin ferrochelatase
MTSVPPHVVLAAHGSRDPRSSATVRAIARAVAAARPDVVVHDAYLEFDRPHPASLLDALAGVPVVVVPLLLTAAYHARTDLPAIVDAARRPGSRITLTEVLSSPSATEALVAGLSRRLPPRGAFDGLILAAAGTRNVAALATIERVAAALGRATAVPCLDGYASGAGRTVAEAAADLRSRGLERIAVASYFLAPGVLHDRALADAGVDGIVALAPPLGAAPEVVAIVSERIDTALGAATPIRVAA